MARWMYKCPICNKIYLELWEANECRDDCADVPDVETVFAEDGACSVINGEIVLDSCKNCSHSDCDGHRWPPCPRNHFAPVVNADDCTSFSRSDHY